MATKKKPARSSRIKKQTDDGVLKTNNIAAKQAGASDNFVAAMPHNRIQEFEHGHDNALAPPTGGTVKPGSSKLTASTTTEETGTAKTGSAAQLGTNATVESLDPVRVDASDQPLRANQGIRIGDNQNTLKAGLRGPSLLEDFVLRNKLAHFDHERVPERIIHARGTAAHGYLEAYNALIEHTRVAPFPEQGKITLRYPHTPYCRDGGGWPPPFLASRPLWRTDRCRGDRSFRGATNRHIRRQLRRENRSGQIDGKCSGVSVRRAVATRWPRGDPGTGV